MDLLQNVRRSLGRRSPLKHPPAPPAIEEPVARLVHTDIGLAELFMKRAIENKMLVEAVRPEELGGKVAEFVRKDESGRMKDESSGHSGSSFVSHPSFLPRVVLSVSPLLDRVGVAAELERAGVAVKTWDQMTLDELYDYDVGVTDVWAAVAETGSLVVRSTSEHGRALSLVPPVHVAVVEPKNLLPDLLDLFEKVDKEGVGGSISIITGPSKTADIEMNLVQGVHGPRTVKIFQLQ